MREKMNKKLLIDCLAVLSKVKIEHTKLHPIAKTSINWSIDRVAEHLKKEVLSDIEKIRSVAKHYGVYKVIVIPCSASNGMNIVFIRAYGGNYAAFFNDLNVQIIPENTINDNLSDILELERKFGVVIYEKL